MMKCFKNTILVTALLSLSACASNVKSNVTRFHQLSEPNGQTIEVISMEPSLQQSIEFGSYASMVGGQLRKAGFNPPSGNASQFVAEIAYSIQSLDGLVAEERSPVSVGVGVGGGRRRGTSFGMGVSTSFGSSNREANYLSKFHMNITDLLTGQRVYEGHVESINRNPSLAQTMPFLINALFQDFPGESGSSNTVTVKPE
jgi:hypothetical protein